MAHKKSIFSRFRFVYRRSSPLVKCVVIAAIVLSIAAMIALGSAIHAARRQTEELRQQAAWLEQENQRLDTSIAERGTVKSIKRIAAEKLGLVDPDTIIFTPKETNPE